MKVREFMSAQVVTANLRDGLHQTWERMREHGIRHMPVLDEHEALVGIISDRDLRRPGTLDLGGAVDSFRLDDHIKVEAAMTGAPRTVLPEDDITQALDLFLDHHFGALPVVDGDRRVLGMLSAFDLLRAFRQRLDAEQGRGGQELVA